MLTDLEWKKELFVDTCIPSDHPEMTFSDATNMYIFPFHSWTKIGLPASADVDDMTSL